MKKIMQEKRNKQKQTIGNSENHKRNEEKRKMTQDMNKIIYEKRKKQKKTKANENNHRRNEKSKRNIK